MNYNMEKLSKGSCLSEQSVLYYIQQRITDGIAEYEEIHGIKLSKECRNYLRGVLTEKMFQE